MSKKLLAEFHRDRFSTVQDCNRILIAHLDGLSVRFPPAHSRGRLITRLLVERELLVELQTGDTEITELGRWALAEILASYADTILLAHSRSGARNCRHS